MLQPLPAPPLAAPERPRIEIGRRTLAIGLALLIEALLLFLLLSLGVGKGADKADKAITVINIDGIEAPEASDEAESQSSAPQAEERPPPQQPPADEPRPPQPAETPPLPDPPPPVPALKPNPVPPPVPRPANRQPPAGKPLYGPVDTGRSSAFRDSERVGTAPNGEPLYAASWYREPRPDQLRDYLSTARGPGWGLIACRTAPDYRVEDCVGLGEYPEGSQITRAILAAAWEFRVRPPRLGGQPLVGSWVRIRIDYGYERR